MLFFHINQTPPPSRKKHSCQCTSLPHEEKRENRRISKERILIENINAKIKVFKIMKYPYRNRRKRHFLRLNLVCGIINYELQS